MKPKDTKLSLVNLKNIDDEARISSAVIAESIGTSYKALNNLIKKHKKRLELFGLLPFKKDANGQKIPAYLNEDQAIFLLTLSRNTEIVVDFKHRLVMAFSKLRRKQAVIDANHAKAIWQQNRAIGKITHRQETDTIKEFISYAVKQGSKGYLIHGYSIMARMINKALSITDRESINESQLCVLATAETICDNELKAGMDAGKPYKEIFNLAKYSVNQFSELALINGA